MEVKKSKKADLEGKKGVFFEIGLVVALGLLFLAFEYKVDNSTTKELEDVVIVAEEEIFIPATSQQMAAPPPPPPPPPRMAELLDIVEDDLDIDDELEIMDVEDDSSNAEQSDYDGPYSEFGEYGSEDSGEGTIWAVVEKNPGFDGDLNKWLKDNIIYPEQAKEFNIQGRVIVQFVVEKDGSITDVKIARSVDPSLDAEAIRVVKAMPKWKPGLQRNKPVRVAFTLPINFRLNTF